MSLIDKMNTLLQIGQEIRKARKLKKMSGVELAALCDIHRGTLAKLESGTGNVELNTLLAICSILKLAIKFTPMAVEHVPSLETPKVRSVLDQYLELQNEGVVDGQLASTQNLDRTLFERPRLALGKTNLKKTK